jgi:ribosomal protein L1
MSRTDRLKGPQNSKAEMPCNVLVTLMAENGARWARVRVYSRKKPDLHLSSDVTMLSTTAATRRVCMITAGAMAEKLCSDYSDNLDTDEVAKLAGAAFKECMDVIARSQ